MFCKKCNRLEFFKKILHDKNSKYLYIVAKDKSIGNKLIISMMSLTNFNSEVNSKNFLT